MQGRSSIIAVVRGMRGRQVASYDAFRQKAKAARASQQLGLAEMRLRVLWEEILARFDKVSVVGEPARVSSCLFRAITNLPVRIAS